MKKAELIQMQKLPLEIKIAKSKQRIIEFYEKYENPAISFSGGKDSTVLLHLIRSIYPNLKGVFVNTGLEFPEILLFVKTVENIDWIKPDFKFKEVCNTYGFPIISKQVSMAINRFQINRNKCYKELQNPKPDIEKIIQYLIQMGLRLKGGYSVKTHKPQRRTIPIKYTYVLKADFKISEKCCDIMKKKPLKKYAKTNSVDGWFLGTMASDSLLREKEYLQHNCNAWSKNISTPLGFWTDRDIWEYIEKYDIKYSKIYDMGQTRTGCFTCHFGHMLSKNDRYEEMRKTHPKLYDFSMNYCEMKKVIDFINDKQNIEDPFIKILNDVKNKLNDYYPYILRKVTNNVNI